MAKSKPIEIWVQLLAVAVVISAGCLYVSWHDGAVKTQPTAVPLTGDELPVPSQAAGVNSLVYRTARPDELVLYSGKDISFSLGLPPRVLSVEGSSTSLVVYEDAARDTVDIITPRDELFFKNDDGVVAITRQNAAEAYSGWHIQFATVTSEADLLKFIRSRYGPRCDIVTQELGVAGVLNIRINDGGVDSPNCAAAGLYFIKYDSLSHRAATWMVGNGGSFVILKGGIRIDFLQTMADSFRFVR